MKKIHKGYTIIELLLVLSIMGIIISLTIPNLLKIDFSTKVNAKQLCMDIRNVRYLRMTEGKAYRIILMDNGYKILNGPEIIKNINFSKKINLQFTYKEIMFSYNGAPNRGDTITVKNTNSNKTFDITIVPASGRILLKDEKYQ